MIHNFKRWLDSAIDSSNQDLFPSMTTTSDTGEKDDNGNAIMPSTEAGGVLKKFDDHTVFFNLNNADLALPECMFDVARRYLLRQRTEPSPSRLHDRPQLTALRCLELAVGKGRLAF